MVIETLDKKYEVIRYLYSDKHRERYVCREKTSEETFTMIRIKEKKWIVKVMDFLMRQLENEDFTDLADCFFSEEHLFIALRYAEGMSLKDKIAYEDSPLEERLDLGRSILDRLLIQNMPDYFMNDCLTGESILIGSGMSIAFVYELEGLGDYQKTRFSDVELKIADIMEALFADELSKKTLSVMERFIKSLKKHAYEDLMTLYTVYDELVKEILTMDPEELAVPKTKAFRAWERFLKILRPVKKVVAVLLILASIGFLVWSAYNNMQTGKPAKVFDYIGTMEIKK